MNKQIFLGSLFWVSGYHLVRTRWGEDRRPKKMDTSGSGLVVRIVAVRRFDISSKGSARIKAMAAKGRVRKSPREKEKMDEHTWAEGLKFRIYCNLSVIKRNREGGMI